MMAHALWVGTSRLGGVASRHDGLWSVDVAFLTSRWATARRCGENPVSPKRHAERPSSSWRLVATKKNPLARKAKRFLGCCLNVGLWLGGGVSGDGCRPVSPMKLQIRSPAPGFNVVTDGGKFLGREHATPENSYGTYAGQAGGTLTTVG